MKIAILQWFVKCRIQGTRLTVYETAYVSISILRYALGEAKKEILSSEVWRSQEGSRSLVFKSQCWPGLNEAFPFYRHFWNSEKNGLSFQNEMVSRKKKFHLKKNYSKTLFERIKIFFLWKIGVKFCSTTVCALYYLRHPQHHLEEAQAVGYLARLLWLQEVWSAGICSWVWKIAPSSPTAMGLKLWDHQCRAGPLRLPDTVLQIQELNNRAEVLRASRILAAEAGD